MWGRQAHPPRGFELVQAEKRPFWLSLITLFGVFSDVDFKGFNPLSWRLWDLNPHAIVTNSILQVIVLQGNSLFVLFRLDIG